MAEEEYKQRAEELYREYRQKQIELDKEYALSNNEVKVGDIVSDSCTTIKVEIIKVEAYGGIPHVYFEGPRLTKKLEPFKSGEKASVYNVKNHIKQS